MQFADSIAAHQTDMDLGVVGSMRQLGVTESYKLKRQVILSASEAAEMILRVDDSKPPSAPQICPIHQSDLFEYFQFYGLPLEGEKVGINWK
jgi:hypothetical protein